ncbi:hypothetical protein EV363DRAFT_1404919 [Boletus edulis]|nr:hypothetical protein EV363DRAFT_1404919 [Boletus edulis]
MTLFSMEVFEGIVCRRKQDEIVTLHYALGTDNLHSRLLDQGILVVDSPQLNPHHILVGWEVQATSWGYISFRGSQYGLDVAELMARAPTTLARSGTD